MLVYNHETLHKIKSFPSQFGFHSINVNARDGYKKKG